MTTQKPKGRFIAGAVCPRCKEMDKLKMYREGDKDVRECVACGFTDEMYFKQQVRELETRVNTSEKVREAETQVLQFVPPKK